MPAKWCGRTQAAHEARRWTLLREDYGSQRERRTILLKAGRPPRSGPRGARLVQLISSGTTGSRRAATAC
jgi:hypothetical protein